MKLQSIAPDKSGNRRDRLPGVVILISIEYLAQQTFQLHENRSESDRRLAELTAQKIKDQANRRAEQELKMAKMRLQHEFAAQAVQLAEDLLKKHFQPSDHDRLVDEYIQGVRNLK